MLETKNLIKQCFKELIHSIAKVEIPTLLFSNTEKVIENIPSELKPTEVETIRSLQKSFEILLETEEKFSSEQAKMFNYIILSGDITNWKKAGQIREWPVPIVGTSYVPVPEDNNSFASFISQIEKISNPKERAIEYLVEGTKRQFFMMETRELHWFVQTRFCLIQMQGLLPYQSKWEGSICNWWKNFMKMHQIKEN